MTTALLNNLLPVSLMKLWICYLCWIKTVQSGILHGGICWQFCLTGSCRRAVVTPMSLLCTKYKMFSEMLGDTQRKVTGQAKQIHQSCCLPGRSVMNNLSGMMDVSDVWFPWITAVTEACHEGQRCTLKDEALSSHQAPFDLSIRLPAVLGDNGAQ